MTDGVEFDSTIEGKTVKLKLIVENIDIERKCDMEYHIAYTQLMKKGILPKATLEKEMKELDIWRDQDEEQLTTIQRQLVDLQIKLEAATTHEVGLAVAKDMGALRADCLKLVEAKAAVLSNSCEALADGIRRDAYIAYATVYAGTGKKVFRDYTDLLIRANEPAVFDAREQLLIVATQTFQESLTGLPEVGYVRSVESQIREDAAEAESKAATATKKKTIRKKATKKATKKKVAKKTAKKKTTRKATN